MGILNFFQRMFEKQEPPRKPSLIQTEVVIGPSPWRFIDTDDKEVHIAVLAKLKLVDTSKLSDMMSFHTREAREALLDLDDLDSISREKTWKKVQEAWRDASDHCIENHWDEIKLDKPCKVSVMEVDHTITVKGTRNTKTGDYSPFTLPRCMVPGDIFIYTTGHSEWGNLF